MPGYFTLQIYFETITVNIQLTFPGWISMAVIDIQADCLVDMGLAAIKFKVSIKNWDIGKDRHPQGVWGACPSQGVCWGCLSFPRGSAIVNI